MRTFKTTLIALAASLVVAPSAFAIDDNETATGDAAYGRGLAIRWCLSCHQVRPTNNGPRPVRLPLARSLNRQASMAIASPVSRCLRIPTWRRLALSRTAVDDIAAYILSWRSGGWHATRRRSATSSNSATDVRRIHKTCATATSARWNSIPDPATPPLNTPRAMVGACCNLPRKCAAFGVDGTIGRHRPNDRVRATGHRGKIRCVVTTLPDPARWLTTVSRHRQCHTAAPPGRLRRFTCSCRIGSLSGRCG